MPLPIKNWREAKAFVLEKYPDAVAVSFVPPKRTYHCWRIEDGHGKPISKASYNLPGHGYEANAWKAAYKMLLESSNFEPEYYI